MNEIIHHGKIGADILVVLPATEDYLELARKAAKIHQRRAGIECDVVIVVDKERKGWVATHNWAIDNIKSKYYVYSCCDYFPGRDYLELAFNHLYHLSSSKKLKLIAFNDGKWYGQIATAGLIETKYAKSIYGSGLFCNEYQHNYADPELTLIAMTDDCYGYCSDAVLMEVDYEKENKMINKSDQAIYNKRKIKLFDGKVDAQYREVFS